MGLCSAFGRLDAKSGLLQVMEWIEFLPYGVGLLDVESVLACYQELYAGFGKEG